VVAATSQHGPSETVLAQHVLVCISGSQDDLRLIRHGAMLAQRLNARVTVLYVLSPPNRPRPVETLQADRLFARSVGASLVEVPAVSVAGGICEFAVERDVSQIVLSDERRTPWYATRHGSLLDEIAGRLSGVEVYVLGDASLAVRG
jgi:two-component system sensor histidine kinase KdpD